jgi:outer membrane receptor protein involved in Fe transport
MERRLQAIRSRCGHTIRPALAAAIVTVLGTAPPVVLAQTAPAAEASGGLQEIVVTATRKEESLSKVPISVTALTQESLDIRGIKDFQDVAKFTPGVNIDNSGTNNISIRGIASTAGAGTTGIYIDDTPIQMRALAFNPDDALPKTFDVERVEVLRGPQGTLFGAGSEGGTVRYITVQPSLSKFSMYSRSEVSYTQGGEGNYEAGIAAGGPVVDGVFGVRGSVWFRRDGGWIDRVNPETLALEDSKANSERSALVRLAGLWQMSEHWSMAPSIYYQDRKRNDVSSFWGQNHWVQISPLSDPGSHRFVSANPTQRDEPDKFYLPALKIEGDLGAVKFISNTSYYHRENTTGYDGTLYNLGFYQSLLTLDCGGTPCYPAFNTANYPLLDANGVHLPASVAGYRAPASVQNNQQNIVQELRLQSNDPGAKLNWTTGLFFSENRQTYYEQIYDPQADKFFMNLAGMSAGDFFTGCAVPLDPVTGDCATGFVPVPLLANGDSYILHTNAKDTQYAVYGEGTYAFNDQWKLTLGARFSRTKFTNDTVTAGPQLFVPGPQAQSVEQSENSFTPKISLAYQIDPKNMLYATYAKGFRPGGGNNPVPYAACAADFENFHLTSAPASFNSDTVQSYEIGAKNNIANRVRLSSSVYYIRWNNIQQTVVPPICQISWISNLGTAVAKGADVQAEFVVVPHHLTLELAAGYTDARYTKDSKISPDADPVVHEGDAIVGQSGQPAPPLTASVGVEYKFNIGERDSFVRLDYEYQGAPKWLGASQDPATVQFSQWNYSLGSTSFFTLRGGINVGNWEIAAFVDNLFDSHTITNYNFTIAPDSTPYTTSGSPTGVPLERDFTFRPRTFGLTFTFRR